MDAAIREIDALDERTADIRRDIDSLGEEYTLNSNRPIQPEKKGQIINAKT